MLPPFGLQVPNSDVAQPPTEARDVSDSTKLKQYRAKRTEWLRWYKFDKDEPNNIQGQIIRMVFLDMSYRMLTKPRGESPQNVNIAARNGLLAHVLDLGYVANQVLAIRRLLDARHDTVSLQRL